MSQRAIKWVSSIEEIGRSERAVLMAMAELADGKGRLIKTAMQIAVKARVCERTAKTYIASLRDRGLVDVVIRRSFSGRQAASLFTLAIAFQSAKNDNSRVSGLHSGQSAKSAPIDRDYNNYNPVEADPSFSPAREEADFPARNDNVVRFPLVGGMGR